MRALPLFGPILLALWASSAPAQDQGRSRAVKIIGGGADAGAATQDTPAAPASRPPAAGRAADNPAGVEIELAPSSRVAVGTKLTIKVTTRKPGYLVLVDVDSSGKLTQIYPNRLSLLSPGGRNDEQNLLKPGKPKIIPESSGSDSFDFVAAQPGGPGMVVAILSDKPLLFVDLPNLPVALTSQARAAEFVIGQTRGLRILPAEDGGGIVEPKWSFAARFYTVQDSRQEPRQ